MRRIWLLILMSIFCFSIPAAGAEQTVSVKIPVSCTAKGLDAVFSYEIEPQTGVSDALLDLKDGQSDGFEISFSEPGNYNYRIFQKPSNVPDLVPDTTEYQIRVMVVRHETGTLAAEVTAFAKGSSEKAPECAFVNYLKDPDGDKPPADDTTDTPPESETHTDIPSKPVNPDNPSGNPNSSSVYSSNRSSEEIQTGDTALPVVTGGICLVLFLIGCIGLFCKKK